MHAKDVGKRIIDRAAGGVTSLELRKGTIFNTLIEFSFFFMSNNQFFFPCYRKRTKKTTVKAGRKKAKTDDIPPSGEATPRTRAAVAREAAIRAALEAEQAEAKARAAMKAAEEASRAALLLLPPATPSGQTTRRYKTETCN